MQSPLDVCLRAIFANSRVLFRYTDNPSELCIVKIQGL